MRVLYDGLPETCRRNNHQYMEEGRHLSSVVKVKGGSTSFLFISHLPSGVISECVNPYIPTQTPEED